MPAAGRGPIPRDPRNPGMVPFWLEFETPIELAVFLASKLCDCRTCVSKNVHKTMKNDLAAEGFKKFKKHI